MPNPSLDDSHGKVSLCLMQRPPTVAGAFRAVGGRRFSSDINSEHKFALAPLRKTSYLCACLEECKLTPPETPPSPASPPNSHEPNPTNRRCVPRRNPQRRLVRTFARPGVSANFARACHQAATSRGAFHFRAASAFAPLERKGSQHLRQPSAPPLASRKGMGRAAHSLERARRPLEPKPRPARREASQFFHRRFAETGSRPQLSLRNNARGNRPTCHLPRRPDRHGPEHAPPAIPVAPLLSSVLCVSLGTVGGRSE